MNLEQICNSFFIDNKHLSSKVLLSYQRQQTKNTNDSSLINYILNNKEFIQYFNNMFDKVYQLLMPNSMEHLETFKKMFMSIKCKEKKGFTEQDIQTFIKEQSRFDMYYTNVIKQLYDFYFTDDITEVNSCICLKQIKDLDFIHDVDVEKKIEGIIYKLIDTSKVINKNKELVVVVRYEHKQYFIDSYKKNMKQEPKQKDLL